ncbi:uncharacterized protein N7511_007246 [Penicillium nucicola]|uniref:uncharacterized protein n=1 Tax=Penicillium nucicola TaxID=1850975 RepID=UPI0025455E1E|nr:uncharacterized protein N7511_007246 [Penicillium nucicola]KAJ5757064.1 hypothetical protein N7511_007246 [Penicillium nucicola]
MHFTKALVFLSAIAPAFAAQAASAPASTQTLTLVPSGYTPPPTVISSAASLTRIPSSSTPLVKATSVSSGIESSVTPTPTPFSGAASLQLSGAIAAGAAAVAGLLLA